MATRSARGGLWLLALPGVAALAVVLGGCVPGERLPDVILITTDTLRMDRLGLYGHARDTSPNVERWFSQATIFENARTTDANTPPSCASLLTGLYPPQHGVRLFYQLIGDAQVTLPEMLPEEFQSAGFVSNLALTDEAMGLAERFDHYDDYVDERTLTRPIHERSARRTTDAALRWLRDEADPERPLFLWIHYIDPHGPYHPPADWERSFTHDGVRELDPGRVPPYQVLPGVRDGLAYLDAYDEEIAYHDAHVGRLLEGLAELRGLDRSLVIFTADHGETLIEHEIYFGHGYNVWDGILRIPLAIRGPGFPAERRTELVSGVDVVPTVLAFLGLEKPSELPGVDLGSPEPITAERVVFSEALGLERFFRSAVQGEGKWVVQFERGKPDIVARSYYDLAADPGELQAGSWPPGLAQDLLVALSAGDPAIGGVPPQYQLGRRLKEPKVDPRASAEVLEKLKALGYVE